MSVREKKLKDGSVVYLARRHVGYTPDGKPDQRSRTFDTRRAAEIYDAKLLAESDAMRGRSGKMTLSQFVNLRYWPAAIGRLAPSSLDTYEKELRLRIMPALGNVDIRDIDRAKVQRMIDRIDTECVARKCLGVLKTILNEAKGDGLIQSNPAEANYAMPAAGEKRDNGLVLTSFSQISDLLAIVREKGSQCVQRIAYTGLLQGLRPEERYALDWSDIDVTTRTLSVDSAFTSASRKHGGGELKETKTKKSTRVLPMHPDFASWVSTQACGGGPFIVGANGKRISPSTAQKRWARFLEENTDATPVTIENMRHSFATSYLHAGGSIEVLSKMLGHANISTTINRYYRPDVDVLRSDLGW